MSEHAPPDNELPQGHALLLALADAGLSRCLNTGAYASGHPTCSDEPIYAAGLVGVFETPL